MKVRATRLGFYEHIRRREGDVFTIADEPRRKVRKTEEIETEEVVDSGSGSVRKIAKRRFRPDPPQVLALADKAGTVPVALGSWMEPVDKRTPERFSTAQQHINKVTDELKADKVAGRSSAGDEGNATGDAEVI